MSTLVYSKQYSSFWPNILLSNCKHLCSLKAGQMLSSSSSCVCSMWILWCRSYCCLYWIVIPSNCGPFVITDMLPSCSSIYIYTSYTSLTVKHTSLWCERGTKFGHWDIFWAQNVCVCELRTEESTESQRTMSNSFIIMMIMTWNDGAHWKWKRKNEKHGKDWEKKIVSLARLTKHRRHRTRMTMFRSHSPLIVRPSKCVCLC